MLVSLNKILPAARKGRFAIGAFNFNNLEMCQGIIAGAVSMKSPVILQTSEGAIEYAGMDYLAAIALTAAAQSKIPVVFHLDHGKNFDLVMKALQSGFYSSVMFDGSSLPFSENARMTREVVKVAHKRSISVEAELGRIFGTEDNVSVNAKESTFTDPDEAFEFVKKTGCDALAVAIGTAHGAHKSNTTPRLDLPRLKTIASRITIPLVLHGASSLSPQLVDKLHTHCVQFGDCMRLSNAMGIPEEQEKKAIKLGITKINIDSDLRVAFTAAVRDALITDHTVIDPRKIIGPARDLIQKIVIEKIKMLGSKGKG